MKFILVMSLLTFSGCVSDGQASTEITTTSSPTPDTTVTPTEQTNSGPTVNIPEAKDRALNAEKRHISDVMNNSSCVNSWSLKSFTGIEEDAELVNQSNGGVVIEVTLPLTYGTDVEEADSRSIATYLVTENSTIRLDGTLMSPCEKYNNFNV